MNTDPTRQNYVTHDQTATIRGTRPGYLSSPGVHELPVDYAAVNGLAIHEGDIELGPLAHVEAEAASIGTLRQRVSEQPASGGDARPSDAVEMRIGLLPNAGRVDDPIADIQARSVIRFVRRTSATAAAFPNYIEGGPYSMLAYMFPGQGSQFSGMGKDLFARYPEQVELADRILGYSIEELCLHDKQRRLNRTGHTQPSLFFVSCLHYLEKTAQEKRRPDIVLGHSLGLYSALFAAGVFDLQTGLEIVARRGALMEAASEGAMLAVIGRDSQALADCLIKYEHHDVDVANYNSASQAVLSGLAPPIETASRHLQQEGFRCIRLPVSGPFHSRYMEPARLEFMNYLLDKPFKEPSCRVISTTSGSILSPDYLVEELSFQLVRPVRWIQTISHLVDQFPDIDFEEIGPNTILSRITKQILDDQTAIPASIVN